MKLYVCWERSPCRGPVAVSPGVWGNHPCKKAHDALLHAGHSPDVMKVYGFAPLPDITRGRKEVKPAESRELRARAGPRRRRGHHGLSEHRGMGAVESGRCKFNRQTKRLSRIPRHCKGILSMGAAGFEPATSRV